MDERADPDRPVETVLAARLPIGDALFPLGLSADWDRPLPGMRRALVVLHGRLRNAATYQASAEAALRAAGARGEGTLLVVPQFLAPADIARHGVDDAVLRWAPAAWMGGAPALSPAPVGAYDAVDAILARLADRARFPNLAEVVVAGHSGGGQVAHRHALLGQIPEGLRLRHVVANPSAYVWFDATRPGPVTDCPDYDRWKYGLRDLPLPVADPRALEARYVARDVTYLLGGEDSDPAHPALDRSCMAAAQGPHRLARGLAYLAHLRDRHPSVAHRLRVVPGVGHDGDAMLTSPDGLDALFGPGRSP